MLKGNVFSHIEKKKKKNNKTGNAESKFQKEGIKIGKLTHFIFLKNSYFLSESYMFQDYLYLLILELWKWKFHLVMIIMAIIRLSFELLCVTTVLKCMSSLYNIHKRSVRHTATPSNLKVRKICLKEEY